MRILILGGTEFLGRHLVEAALAKGHEVTLFNRGKTNPHLFPDVEKLRGDRDGNLDVLRGRHWDAVIDPSGYVPRIVRQSVQLLEDAVGHYTFVSSISVYADFSRVGMDENASVGKLDDETNEDVNFYGPLKALCEREVQSVFGERALMIRPGLIVGPYDPTDRFTYWVRRFSQDGEVLVPGRRDRPIQFIDVMDLAKWMITMVERRSNGIFNATGPKEKFTMEEFVRELENSIPLSGRATWVSEDFLWDKGVKEWTELPLWISDRKNYPGFLTINVNRAIAHGLTFRPLPQTIMETLRWDQTRPQETALKAGMSRKRESELLRDWKEWDAR
jgi:2'-hydroxyisoflavone reductase